MQPFKSKFGEIVDMIMNNMVAPNGEDVLILGEYDNAIQFSIQGEIFELKVTPMTLYRNLHNNHQEIRRDYVMLVLAMCFREELQDAYLESLADIAEKFMEEYDETDIWAVCRAIHKCYEVVIPTNDENLVRLIYKDKHGE